MAFVAVDKDGTEWIWEEEPIRQSEEFRECFNGCQVVLLPQGTIFKIINRVLTWEDEPVEI